mmetsp:Transcript_8470/g.13755  ORF Transcript_8470/g.13755 Transcript_8470/m.13755 type:complete len:209 (-) Transcript_8470:72-698(-)
MAVFRSGRAGSISGYLRFLFGDLTMVTIPSFNSFGLSYVLYFFFGAIAGQNSWFEDLVEISRCSRIVLYAGAVVWTGLVEVFMIQGGAFGFELALFPAALSSLSTCLLTGLFVYWTQLSLCFSLVVFFHDYCNWTNKLSPFFWASAYTAYLIQKPLIFLAVYLVLRVSGPAESNASGYYYFIVGIPVTLLIWPVAFVIRSIPGFSKVL